MLGERLALTGAISVFPEPDPKPKYTWFLFLLFTMLVLFLVHAEARAGVRIPGTDASDKLEAAGTLLRVVDSMLFVWGARIFAGICIMSAGWHLKEQRFGPFVLCAAAAILLGTAPIWVRNIFDIGGGGGIFTSTAVDLPRDVLHA
ncbi:hypothetical protein FACS1894126_1400 [Alphaproteobacteria bacterium]|jgi:hypothetical protein|nr:hypothetical protein FACS1894126_1400 [Alphaproteobacteria bacterium]